MFSFKKCLFVLTISFLPLNSCIERNLNAFEENAGTYSLYGAMDMSQDVHYIRINNVQTPVVSDFKESFDGVVTFVDVETGNFTELQDTIVNFSGFITHNFIIDKSLQPNRQYEVIVERIDGKQSKTTVTTPGLTSFQMEPSSRIGCETPIQFTFGNVEQPEFIRMEVGFHYQGTIHWSEIGLVAQLQSQENSSMMAVSMSPRNLLVEVFPPSQILSTVDPRNLKPSINCNKLDSKLVHIRYTHYGPEWDIYSPGYFPINPLEWQDVEGGLGFLGAFRRDSTTFTIQLPQE